LAILMVNVLKENANVTNLIQESTVQWKNVNKIVMVEVIALTEFVNATQVNLDFQSQVMKDNFVRQDLVLISVH
jgi:hypothetical protein